jgi:four helix bundle protein
LRDFNDLEVWRCAHVFTLELYKVTAKFPRHEMYGLTSQLRRGAVSIEANIAEGAGKKTSADFAHFLQIAFGSANEIQCELLIAKDLGYLSEIQHSLMTAQVGSVKKMLTRFMQFLCEDKHRDAKSDPGSKHPIADGRQPTARYGK